MTKRTTLKRRGSVAATGKQVALVVGIVVALVAIDRISSTLAWIVASCALVVGIVGLLVRREP